MDRKAECEVWTDIMLQRQEMTQFVKVNKESNGLNINFMI